jgi:hypothetical protein
MKILYLVAGFTAVGSVVAIWSSNASSQPASAGGEPATRESARAHRELPWRNTSGRDGETAKIPGRSSNLRVRKLADKLAKDFGRDPTRLAALLSDETLGSLAYQAGRDLITLFPEQSEELLAAFKATKPAELAANLCGDLIADVSARLGGEEALALADTLEPSSARDLAFRRLGSSLNPAEFKAVLEKAMTAGFPEDVRHLENAMIERAGSLSSSDLERLMSLDLSPQVGHAIRASYGDQLVAANGRQGALEEALALPAGQQAEVIQGILRRGSMQDQGAAWLLESLSTLDPALGLDRNALTIGATQRMLSKDGPAAMDWAAGIADPALRDATVKGGMQSWLQQDSMEASAWLSKQLSGPAKDAAIFQMTVFLTARGEGDSARRWMDQIQNRQMKDAVARKIAEGANRPGL